MKATKPELWTRIKKKVKASSDGGESGRWSARKAAIAQLQYRKAGGKWEKATVPPARAR